MWKTKIVCTYPCYRPRTVHHWSDICRTGFMIDEKEEEGAQSNSRSDGCPRQLMDVYEVQRYRYGRTPV